MRIFILLFFLASIIIPEPAAAQGILGNTCSGIDCSACNVVQVANTFISWLIGMVMVLFAVLIVVAGFGLVTSNGNPAALTAAKSKFTNAFIGLLIVLSAWVVVDTLMRGVVGNNGQITGYGPWSEVRCTIQVESRVNPGQVAMPNFWIGDPASPANNAEIVASERCIEYVPGMYDCDAAEQRCPTGSVPSANGSFVNCVAGGQPPSEFSGEPASSCSGNTCAALTVPCKAGANCSISPDMVDRIAGMHNTAGVNGARVTEGFPPTREHKSRCHYNGTCIDYSKAGGMTSAEVKAVADAALANGLRPVYEVTSESRRQELISAGVPASSVKNLGSWISAEHFSIYGQ